MDVISTMQSIAHFVMVLDILSLRKNIMSALLTSHQPKPKLNLVEFSKNSSGIKTLTFSPHSLKVSEKYKHIGVVFDTESKA